MSTFELSNVIPVELSILPDGNVRLYCMNRGRLFRFMNTYLKDYKPATYKHYRTGVAAIFPPLPAELLLDLRLYTKDSNWERLAKKTEVVTNFLFTEKGNPRSLDKVFNLKAVKSAIAQVDEQINSKITEQQKEKEAEKDLAASAK